MTTLLINIEGKSEASFIEKLLQKFSGVKKVNAFSKKELQRMVDILEEEEDIRDIKASKARGEKFHKLDDVVTQWKKEGKL